jgi:hypothetical protein
VRRWATDQRSLPALPAPGLSPLARRRRVPNRRRRQAGQVLPDLRISNCYGPRAPRSPSHLRSCGARACFHVARTNDVANRTRLGISLSEPARALRQARGRRSTMRRFLTTMAPLAFLRSWRSLTSKLGAAAQPNWGTFPSKLGQRRRATPTSTWVSPRPQSARWSSRAQDHPLTLSSATPSPPPLPGARSFRPKSLPC